MNKTQFDLLKSEIASAGLNFDAAGMTKAAEIFNKLVKDGKIHNDSGCPTHCGGSQ